MSRKDTLRQKQIVRVLEAIRDESCNTTRDVADVTGLPIAVCSNYISELVRDGTLKRVGRKMRNEVPCGPPYLVFELVERKA